MLVLLLMMIWFEPILSIPLQELEKTEGIYVNESRSLLLPDNETIINLKVAVKHESPVMGQVSSVIQSPAVLDQLVAAVSRALDIKDKEEARAIESSIVTAFQSIGSDKEKDMSDPFQVMLSPSMQKNNGHTLDHSLPAPNIHTNVKPSHETSPQASNPESSGKLSSETVSQSVNQDFKVNPSPETASQHSNLDTSRQPSLETGSQGSNLNTNEKPSLNVPPLVQETNMKTAKTTESKNKTNESNRPADKTENADEEEEVNYSNELELTYN